jgi:hypothetical protein
LGCADAGSSGEFAIGLSALGAADAPGAAVADSGIEDGAVVSGEEVEDGDADRPIEAANAVRFSRTFCKLARVS